MSAAAPETGPGETPAPRPPWDLSTREGYRQMLQSGSNPNPAIVEEILAVYFPGGATTRQIPGEPPPAPAPARRPRPAAQADTLFDLPDQ